MHGPACPSRNTPPNRGVNEPHYTDAILCIQRPHYSTISRISTIRIPGYYSIQIHTVLPLIFIPNIFLSLVEEISSKLWAVQELSN